jgi:hypothetical protein
MCCKKQAWSQGAAWPWPGCILNLRIYECTNIDALSRLAAWACWLVGLLFLFGQFNGVVHVHAVWGLQFGQKMAADPGTKEREAAKRADSGVPFAPPPQRVRDHGL